MPTIFPDRRSETSLFAVVAALWGILFLQFLTGHRLISHDSLEQFYETAYFNSQALRHGQLPWWNPYLYSGYPQIADPQGMMFSPLLMLLMVAVEGPGVAWFDFAVLLHQLVGGWGCVVLCRAYRFVPLACVLAAVVYMTGGVAAARLQHTPIILAYACLPWLLYTTRRFLSHPDPTNALFMGLVAGILLTHLVQATYLFGLFLFAYACARIMTRRSEVDVPPHRRLVGGFALAMTLALLIAGLQIAATFAVLPLSTRGSFSFEVASAAALSPKAFLTLLWPNVYGNLDGVYSGVADPTESSLYVGVVPCCVLLIGLGKALSSVENRVDKFVLCGSLVFACAYAVGASTPLYKALYATLPGISLFRRPSDAAFLFNFCVALLAGFSASTLVSGSQSASVRRLGVAILSIAAAWYFAIALAEWANGGKYWPIALLGAITVLLVLIGLRRDKTQTVLLVGITLVMLGDMRVFNLPNRLNSRSSDDARFFDAPGSILQAVKADLLGNPAALPFRVEATMTADNLWANGGLVHGLSSTQGYNPLRLREYSEIFGAQESALTPRPFTPALPSLDSPLFSLAGTRYLVTAVPIEELAAGGNVNGHFQKIRTERGLTLWRNKVAYERILTPTQAKLIPEGKRPIVADFEKIDFNQTVVLYPRNADEAHELLHLADRCSGKAALSDIVADNNNLEFEVNGAAASWVVVGDLDFPGWQALVDNHEVHTWRANGLFRALCVPGGIHKVRYSFSATALINSVLKSKSNSRAATEAN